MYPENDEKFEEAKVTKVDADGSGWTIKRDDGWSFFVPPDSPIAPEVGMTARFYGDGIGRGVRGLFLDGQQVFYRNEADYESHQKEEMYGKDASDWLRRWDKGEGVWSVEMGGLGPGYEQCIHITAAEILRKLIADEFDLDAPDAKEAWDRFDNEMLKVQTIKGLGLSGAQYGAARNLATMLYKNGPIGVMSDERVKDRHIQVSRTFPVAG